MGTRGHGLSTRPTPLGLDMGTWRLGDIGGTWDTGTWGVGDMAPLQDLSTRPTPLGSDTVTGHMGTWRGHGV